MEIEYAISDIQERAFFIENKNFRKKIDIMCFFAKNIKCNTFSAVKERIDEIGDSSIIECVMDGTIELLLKEIFSKKLWSEDI